MRGTGNIQKWSRQSRLLLRNSKKPLITESDKWQQPIKCDPYIFRLNGRDSNPPGVLPLSTKHDFDHSDIRAVGQGCGRGNPSDAATSNLFYKRLDQKLDVHCSQCGPPVGDALQRFSDHLRQLSILKCRRKLELILTFPSSVLECEMGAEERGKNKGQVPEATGVSRGNKRFTFKVRSNCEEES